jgi:precorrin-2 dehydrogenase/sirohydrochlorin ferrochelatase
VTDAAQTQAELLPLFLKLEGRPVLVVGAGPVAEGKVGALLGARARVRLVAPDATPTLQRLASEGHLEWRQRRFEEADVDGVWLVFAATSDAAAQRAVNEAASALHVFCIAVDDPPNASAYSGGVVRRPPFTIAISSSGAAPALTRLVREIVEQVLPGQEWVGHAQRLRARWLAEGTPMADRFAELVRELAARAHTK